MGALPVKVEVLLFFMYGCFPCYAFEPEVDGWETKAEYVDLVRVPVVFNAQAEVHARAHYTAEALGMLDEVRDELFAEIHERGNRLDTDASVARFFARFGVDEATFRRIYRSPEVDAKVTAAVELGRSLGITAAPSLVVARRYLTSPTMTGSYADTLAVADRLAASVHDEATRSDRCRTRTADVRPGRPPAADEQATAPAEPSSLRGDARGACAGDAVF